MADGFPDFVLAGADLDQQACRPDVAAAHKREHNRRGIGPLLLCHVQNGDVYADQHGPKYRWLKDYWADLNPEGRAAMAANVSEEGFRDEFVGELPGHLAERVSPDLWTLHWRLMDTPQRRANVVGLFEDQARTLDRFPLQQQYLRGHRPPALIAWGPHDGYMPEGAARAYLRDLPDAELHLLDAGHWALETSLDEITGLTRDFLSRVHG